MSVGLYLQILGLAILLGGLLILAAWGLRRMRYPYRSSQELIKVKAVKPLTYKSQLAVVEIAGEEILIGLGEGGPRLICKLEGKSAGHGA